MLAIWALTHSMGPGHMPKYFAVSLLSISVVFWVNSLAFYHPMSTPEHPSHFRAIPGSPGATHFLYHVATPRNRAATSQNSI